MQPMQVVRPEITPPAGRDFWTDYQAAGSRPTFTVAVTASVFFARPKIWLLRHIYAGNLILDDSLIELPRSEGSSVYRLQLAHIERISHALFSRGNITVNQFENSLLIVKAIGSNYKLI